MNKAPRWDDVTSGAGAPITLSGLLALGLAMVPIGLLLFGLGPVGVGVLTLCVIAPWIVLAAARLARGTRGSC
jgi:hypothetical protein